MSTGSSIEWTEATWNPVVGCTRASAGCDNCYSVTMTHRLEAMGQSKYAGLTVLNNRGDRHFNGTVRTVPEALEIPLKWRKPRRVFVNSMSDLFHRDVPFEFIDKVFAVMALCPQHTFQVLTKRPERMAEYLDQGGLAVKLAVACRDMVGRSVMPEEDWSRGGRVEAAVDRFTDGGGVLPNVWLGASAENQKLLQERLKHLVQCPAAVRFLSCEPLLGPINLNGRLLVGQDAPDGDVIVSPAIHWVIVGGESGPASRSCRIEWIRSIVEQCKAADVACFTKQLGARVDMSFDEWNALTSGGADGSVNFVLDAPHSERGIWRPTDSKGGDIDEFPDDLRVREFPR